MTLPKKEFSVRRIAVAIDSSAHATAALEAAADLAAQLHAELEGIFVRDIALTRLAALPVGREIQFLTGRGRDFTADALDAQNREQEISARRAIATAAAHARVTHAFRVAHGQVAVEVISAAGNADLLILGIGSRSPGGRARLGDTARAAAEGAPSSVLLAKPGTRLVGTSLVCYDGSDGAKRALEAAMRIFAAREKGLTVLIISEDIDEATILREEVEDRLNLLRVQPKFLYSTYPAPHQMCQLASESGADVLVMAADSQVIAGAQRLRILESIVCPVLIVR